MIRVLMEAGQAKAGDEIEVAGLQYQVRDVEHTEKEVVIAAARIGDTGLLFLHIDPEAQFQIVAPDQDGQA